MKKVFILLFAVLLLSAVSFSSNSGDDITVTIKKYREMGLQELLDRGNSFLNNNNNDSAMICYSLIFNDRHSGKDAVSQKILCEALNKSSRIYFYNCNYKQALEYLLSALDICESIGYTDYIGRVYNNIGNIYYQFKNYKLAKHYYDLAYKNGCDKWGVLNNLGMLAKEEGHFDSALFFYRKTYIEVNNINDSTYSSVLNNIAMVYQSLKEYDSAFFYCRAALNNIRHLKGNIEQAKILSSIGTLHLELKNIDSALYYLELSNNIAEKLRLNDVLYDNYLLLSDIEESRGNIKSSFDYYKKYSTIKDSTFSTSEYGTITEMQFMYDMAKVDKQIKELNIEQEIKEKTIIIQRRSQIIMMFVILIIVISLIVLYNKNKTINRAYNKLVAKNVEIINSDIMIEQLKLDYEQRLKEKDFIINKMLNENKSDVEKSRDDSAAGDNTKYKKSSLSDDSKSKLVEHIRVIMNDKEIVCDPDFSLDRLVEMVGSNSAYVSQIINDYFKKHFRILVNEYRVKEACRILSDSEYEKYSIDAISKMVGFKHKSSFNPIFKEIVGVTPSFYIKSVKK